MTRSVMHGIFWEPGNAEKTVVSFKTLLFQALETVA